MDKKKKIAGWYLPITEKHLISYCKFKPNKNGEYQKEQRLKSLHI